MANTNFQGNNGVVIIDHTKISTPTNILIKGTNQAPERKNLLCKDLFRSNNITLDNVYNSTYVQKYDAVFVYSNKASNNRVGASLTYRNLKAYLDSSNADKTYTLTFKINKVQNVKGSVKCNIFNNSSNLSVTNETSGLFSVTGKITKYYFDLNWVNLFSLDLTTDKILEQGKEVVVEIEFVSLELGDHVKDPLLYMPETQFENSIINNLEETPLISSNSLTTVGEYRLEGEVSLFLEQIQNLITENYELFKPSKQELHITNILSGRI